MIAINQSVVEAIARDIVDSAEIHTPFGCGRSCGSLCRAGCSGRKN